MNMQQMIQVLSHSRNPMMLMNQMGLGNNPVFQRAMQMGRGKSEDEVKVILKNLANQRGIDVDQLNLILNPMGLKL